MFKSDLWLILWWCIYGAYMLSFIRIRRSTKLEYTSSLLDDESLICCCRHMHKDHIIQLWCRIPIVLGTHMDKDCRCWWYQEVLTKDHELKIHSAIYNMLDTWNCTIGWWWVLTCMMIGWYLHIHGYKIMQILMMMKWLWCFSHVI